jgi:NADH-quinone oxidoreductase subunit J
MSSTAFVIITIFTLAAALAAAMLQKLMHAALSFAVALVGLAAFFFLLGAEFVGLALVFIYIGAVAVLIVFTILLTRRDVGRDRGFNPPTPKAAAGRTWGGVLIPLAVFCGLTWSILKTQSLSIVAPHIRALTVKRIGDALMTSYVWPLQCVGVLLTTALIGALILVMEEER